WTTSFLRYLFYSKSEASMGYEFTAARGSGGVPRSFQSFVVEVVRFRPDRPDRPEIGQLGLDDGVDLLRGEHRPLGGGLFQDVADGLRPADDHRADGVRARPVLRHALGLEVLELEVEDHPHV